MAKTTDPNIFLVKPTWVSRVINNPSVWYLKSLTFQQRLSLTTEGTIITASTKNGRGFTVAAVANVKPGATYSIHGTTVSVPEHGTPANNEDKPSKDEINQAIYDEAHAAGMAAAKKCVPTPMIVTEHANPWDDSSPIVKQYAPVMGGVCGFAWVNVRPGTCSFARWASKRDIGYADSYHGGYTIYVHGTHFPGFEQSMEIKEAYAGAFAAVLRSHDIKASARSRMD